MSLDSNSVGHVLLSLGVLLAVAHVVGHLFVRLHQPRVIGEITGGLLLGPTLLGAVAPGLSAQLFPKTGPVPVVLGTCYHLGLLLLMFCSGAEIRHVLDRSDSRPVIWITVVGMLVPFAVALLLFAWVPPGSLVGPAHSRTALLLVFGLAVAVTSIPVISRIMADLGILDTSFARVVLGVAVLEDAVIYVVLAVALGLVTHSSGEIALVPHQLGLDSGVGSMAFHVAATLVVFGLMVRLGGAGFAWSTRVKGNVLRANALAYQLLYMFLATLLCVVLGITPMFGAFLAGISVSVADEESMAAAREAIKGFSFGFFIPIYFALVGLQLDLVHHFDPVFFVWFGGLATVVKALSVYAGAVLGGESRAAAWNFAAAMNARGGPGIVLASVSFAAGIVNQSFFAAMVLLAVVTSLLAGSWLGHVVRRGGDLRPARPAPATPLSTVANLP